MGKKGKKHASSSGSTSKYEVQEQEMKKMEDPKCEDKQSDKTEEKRELTPGEKKLLRQMERDKKYEEEMLKSKLEPSKSEKKSKSEMKKKNSSEKNTSTKIDEKKQEEKQHSLEDEYSSHTAFNYNPKSSQCSPTVTKGIAEVSLQAESGKNDWLDPDSNQASTPEKSTKDYSDTHKKHQPRVREKQGHSPSRRDRSDKRQSGDQEEEERPPTRRGYNKTNNRQQSGDRGKQDRSPWERAHSDSRKRKSGDCEKEDSSPLRRDRSDSRKRNQSDDRGKQDRSPWERARSDSCKRKSGDHEKEDRSPLRRDRSDSGKRKQSKDRKKSDLSPYTPPFRRNDRSDFRGNEKSQRKFQEKYEKQSDYSDYNSYKKDSYKDKKSWHNRNARQDTSISYDVFESKINREKIDFNKVKEISGDLFEAPDDYSLGHCVAEDMQMGAGIAIQFRNKFKKQGELLDQNVSTGGVAVLKHKERYIYYLVTKTSSYSKPTYSTLFSSLMEMKKHMLENEVKKLAIPQIGCGLDRLDWGNVKQMLEFIFQDTDVQIDVYSLDFRQTALESQAPPKPVKAKKVNRDHPLIEIEYNTGLIYFGTEDSHITEEIKSLDTKYPRLIEHYKNQKKSVGNVLRYEIPNQDVIYGCIWKQKNNDPICYSDLEKCCYELKKMNRKDGYEYFGFDAPLPGSITLDKIINIFQSVMIGTEIYICWPEYIRHTMPVNRVF